MNLQQISTRVVGDHTRAKLLLSTGKDAATKPNMDLSMFGCSIDGYQWQIRVYCSRHDYISLVLFLASEPRGDSVTVNLRARVVDPMVASAAEEKETTVSSVFKRPWHYTMPYLLDVRKVRGDSFTVECTITVLKDNHESIPPPPPPPPPPSNLSQHLGELLRSKAGADVTFVVSGESFAAHKNILAARSPVFMAEFFGHMEETSSGRVDIKEMEAAVFETMLYFMYTDSVPPELDENLVTAATLLQHLLVAADRYSLDWLKVICEHRLAHSISVGTVATTLALAEQHGFPWLKGVCVEFISGGSHENLETVLETEGYKDLEASTPRL
ncbi:hypothetical protein ACP4OV_028056 [Aristida adscensionis]